MKPKGFDTTFDECGIPWRIDFSDAKHRRLSKRFAELNLRGKVLPERVSPAWIPVIRKKMKGLKRPSALELEEDCRHFEFLNALQKCAGMDESELTETLVFKIRKLFYPKNSARSYRLRNTKILSPAGLVLDERFPSPKEVNKLMSSLVRWYSAFKKKDPVLAAASLDAILLSIHPFSNGNGRVGRMLQYLLLKTSGIELVEAIHPEYIVHLYYKEYVEALLRSRKQKTLDPYLEFFFEKYLLVAESI